MFISRPIQSPVIRIGLHLIVPVCPVSSLSAAAVQPLIVSRLSLTLLDGPSSLSAP